MKKNKKVAFIVTALNSGGIENYLLRFLTYNITEIDATVYCRANYIGDLKGKYEAINVKVVPFKLSYFNPLNYVSFYFKLRKEHFDSIVDFCGNISGLTLLTGRLALIKNRIAFYRNSSDRFNRDFFRGFYDNLMNRLVRLNATHVLANSRAGLEFYFPEHWSLSPKYEVIYNGINADEFTKSKDHLRAELNIPSGAFVIGHTGRYNNAKNHITIIKVAEVLCNKYKDIYFILCGAGVDFALKDEIQTLGLEKRVLLLGYRSDVINVLNTCDAFYFPSLTEGQPNALIEAMVAGLPFVASNIDPIKETVKEEYHIQLVPPNSVFDAVRKLEQLYNKESVFSLKEWASQYFRPDFWFNKFLSKL